MVSFVASFDVLLPHRFSIARDARLAARDSGTRSFAGCGLSSFQYRALGSRRCAAASPHRALRLRHFRLHRLASPRSHLPFHHTRLAGFCSARLLSASLHRCCRDQHHSLAPFLAPMTKPAAPNGHNRTSTRCPQFGGAPEGRILRHSSRLNLEHHLRSSADSPRRLPGGA